MSLIISLFGKVFFSSLDYCKKFLFVHKLLKKISLKILEWKTKILKFRDKSEIHAKFRAKGQYLKQAQISTKVL